MLKTVLNDKFPKVIDNEMLFYMRVNLYSEESVFYGKNIAQITPKSCRKSFRSQHYN